MKIFLITVAALVALIFIAKAFSKEEPTKTPNQIMTTFANAQDYVNKIKPAALALQQNTGIPYLFILAQTALETGWGKSSLVGKAFNFGGIKATAGQPFETAWTWEYVTTPNNYPNRDKSKDVKQASGKTKIWVQQNFAKYPDLVSGLTAYSKILLLPRYKAAFNYKNDPYKFAAEIWKGGYATDPNYVSKISSMIDSLKKNYKA